MKLKLPQVIGIIVVIAFAAVYLATLVMQPGNPAATSAAPRPATPGAAAPGGPAGPPPSVPSDPTAVGSSEAKDDLYCQGLIDAARRAAPDPTKPENRHRLLMSLALASSGADRLIREGIATRETTAIFADAHTTVAAADFAAGRPRLPLSTCEARAEAALKALGK